MATNQLRPRPGLSAPIVTSIPAQWSAEWFRQFITNFLTIQNAVLGTSVYAPNGAVLTADLLVDYIKVPLDAEIEAVLEGFDTSGFALKGIAQTISGQWTFDLPILEANGNVAQPSYSFANETTTGMYWQGPGSFALTVQGTDQIVLTDETATFASQILAQLGSASAPAYSFGSESTSGLFANSDGSIGVAIGGAQAFEFGADGQFGIGATPDYGTAGYWLASGGATAPPTWNAPAALTETSDTNVTLTLGGDASTALLNAASITAGWTGQLSVARGGTGAATLTSAALLVGEGTSAVGFLSPSATVGQVVRSTGSAWAAATLGYGDLATIAANSVLGNNTASPATAIALTQMQLTTMVNAFTSSLSGAAPASGGGTANYLRADGAWAAPPGATAGTVTSVALADGSTTAIYGITGSPVTTSGTLTFSLNTQSANLVLAGPATGSAAQPTFRALAAADLPLATTSAFGAVKPDGTTITISGGVISAAGGSGTVTAVSVVSANGLAGTVANATTTPAITISTTITGILKGNGTAISAATSGTDYSAGTSTLATGILKSTTSTGALTIAVAGDFPTLNQNTTGSAGSLVAGGFANPSASVGLSAVNGSALTAMGSDSAPALSQAISPTWTGAHVFNPPSGFQLYLGANANGAVLAGMPTGSGAVGQGFLTAYTDNNLYIAAPASGTPTGGAISFQTNNGGLRISGTVSAVGAWNIPGPASGFPLTLGSNSNGSVLQLTPFGSGAAAQGALTYYTDNNLYIAAPASGTPTGGAISFQSNSGGLAVRMTINANGTVSCTQAIGVNGATPPAQSTGWGTPSGGSVQNNYTAGALATLTATSEAVAQIITVLKQVGIFGA